MRSADDGPLRGAVRALTLVVLGVSIGVGAVGLVGAGTASAHAILREIEPTNGEVVDDLPAEVVLTFSEPVSLQGGSVRVLDDEAATVSGAARTEGVTVIVPVGPNAGTGTFTVAFEVISADSHRISGATVFHVGSASLAEPVTATSESEGLPWWMSALAVAFGFGAYAAALVAVGLWWFTVFAARTLPGESSLGGRLGGVAERAAAFGIVLLVAGLPARIARTAGGTDALADDAVLFANVRGPLGVAALVSAVGLAGVAAGVSSVRRSGGRGTVASAFGLVALAGFAFEGHTRSQRPLPLMVGFDLLHLVAGAVWVGGVAGLVLAFRARTDPPALAGAVSRFSAAAVWSVIAVSAAGIGMAVIVLPSLGALTSTGYGVTLIVKVALVAVVAALGGYNRRWLVPAISGEGPELARGRLSRVVQVELVVLVAVLALTAALVTRSPVPSSVAAPAAPAGRVETEVALTGDAGSVVISVDPAQVGTNTIELALVGPDGDPLSPIEPPVVELSERALGVGPLRPSGAEFEIPVAGDWEVTVRVRLSEFQLVSATTTITFP